METNVPRAKRIVLTVPVAYRVAGEEEWFHGRMLNLSESGVMFGPTGLQRGKRVEVMFSTPIRVESIAPGKLICFAEVVRTTPTGHAAARFHEWRFLLET